MTTSLYITIATLVILGSASWVEATSTYATNVTSGSVQSSSAVLTWLAPDDVTAADSYLITVLDEQFATVINVTIADVATTSYTVTGLVFSTWHNATLATLDSSGSTVGSESHSFLTEYDPVNFRAVCAIGIVGGLVVILVAVKVAAKVCNPDKAAEKWKQEILMEKQREKEERRKKLSSQAEMA